MLYLTLGPFHFESARVGSVTIVLVVQCEHMLAVLCSCS